MLKIGKCYVHTTGTLTVRVLAEVDLTTSGASLIVESVNPSGHFLVKALPLAELSPVADEWKEVTHDYWLELFEEEED